MSTLPDVNKATFYVIGHRKFLLLGEAHIKYTGCPDKTLIFELKNLFQNTPELRYDLMLESITKDWGNQSDRIQGRTIRNQLYLDNQDSLIAKLQQELEVCLYQKQSHQILRNVPDTCQSNVWYHDINTRSYTNFGYEYYQKLNQKDLNLRQFWLYRNHENLLQKLFSHLIFDDDSLEFNERYRSNILNFKYINPLGFDISMNLIINQMMGYLTFIDFNPPIISDIINASIMDLYAIARFERTYRGRDEVNDFPDTPENVIIIGGWAHTDLYDEYLSRRYPNHQREYFESESVENRCIPLPFTLEEFFTEF